MNNQELQNNIFGQFQKYDRLLRVNLIFISIILLTVLFYFLTEFLLGDNPYFQMGYFEGVRVLMIGVSYILLGHASSVVKHKTLQDALYALGAVLFLGAAFILGIDNIIFVMVVFPVLSIGIITLGSSLKNQVLAIVGLLFLICYVVILIMGYLTNFWIEPAAFIGGILAIMGIGYGVFYLNKKYF